MLRITGGEFRGRNIQAPANLKTRPTQARLRQALFNSLQTSITDESRILDLFAGSGALGFEALSRGASFAVFVEEDRQAVKLIEKNAATLGVADRTKVICDSVANFRKLLPSIKFDGKQAVFDLIFADPPYAKGWETKLIEELPWDEILSADGRFSLEWGLLKSKVSELPEVTSFLVKVREKIYGESVLTTYGRNS